MYEPGRGRDAGGGRDMGRGSNLGRGSDARGSALRAPRSSTACTRVLVAPECALGFACLPNCSPAPYGSSVMHLRFSSPMCWAVSKLSTLPHLLTCFTPIHAAVSGQEC